MVVHRALQPLLENPPKPVDRTPPFAEIGEIARHVSDTERTSAEAEGESKQLKMMEYLEHVVGAAEPPMFDGLVTDARPMGLMVEIPGLGVRGVVKREDLPDGRWRFEAHRMAWVAMDGRMVQSGMRVPLRIIGIDRERRFVDFTIAGKPTTAPKTMPTRRPGLAPKKHEQPKPKAAAKAGPPPHRKQTNTTKHRRRR
ncbi:MAG: ribonuclease [Verrucomicrobiota bacterium]